MHTPQQTYAAIKKILKKGNYRIKRPNSHDCLRPGRVASSEKNERFKRRKKIIFKTRASARSARTQPLLTCGRMTGLQQRSLPGCWFGELLHHFHKLSGVNTKKAQCRNSSRRPLGCFLCSNRDDVTQSDRRPFSRVTDVVVRGRSRTKPQQDAQCNVSL